MLDAFITSTVSLRARESSLPFSANDYSHCTYPFFYSSSRSCCCCCYSSNQLYKVPVSPNYCCNSYGLRQSSLIQCRRFVRSGFNQCYRTRLPVFHSSESCYCDRVCDFREKTVCRRKGGFRRCTVFDEMSEMYDIGGMEEAEVILGLMMEDVEDECFRVKKETRRYLKKPVVVLEKRENDEVNKKFVGKKKIVDAEIEPMYEKNRVGNLRKRDDSRREEIIWRKEQEDKLLKNGALREKEEVDLLLTKPSRKVDVEQEKEFILRNDNRQRMEKREDLMRGEDQRDKVRRDGSTCSSYYSFSSGDYENENDTELREEIFLKDSSRSRVRNLRTETVNHNYKENDQKKSIVETDFRKKSEKILNDISVKEMSSNEKTLVKDLNFSNGHESNNGKVSDHYSNYDARKVKLNESGRLDHDSRQSETRLKYKHISQMQDNVVGNSYGSQNSEISGKIASQENVGDRSAVGLYSREGNKYKHNSHKVSDGSKTREIDISRYTSVSHESDISRNTSISQQKIETKDYSTNALVSALVESGDTSLCLTDKTGKSIIKSESDKLIKVEDRLDLAYGSSLESNQSRSHKQAKVIKSVDARNESDEFITHSGNTGGISVDNTNTTPTYLPDTEVLSMAPKVNTLLSEHYSSYGQPSKFISHEDATGSAARLEKSSSHYVGEFVNQGSEFLSAEIQQEKSHKTKYVQEEQNILIESTSEDPCLEEHGLKHDGKPSGSKIPSDETWKVDGQYRKELPKAVIQENERKSNNAIAKRNGKSLWNMFADVVRLGWSPRSESHGSSRKTVGKSSPNQSTSSETWFSGHDENEGASITNGLSLRHQEEKTQSLVKEGSSSSTSDGYLKSAGINALSSSSSVVVETSGGADSDGNLGVTSSKAAADSAISIPALRLRRFSSMQVGLKPGEEGHTPNSGVSMEHPESVVNVGELKRNKLLRKDHFVKDRFDEWEEAYRVEAEQKKTDEMFMREAILEAKKAAENWEVPVGAVLVHNGKIIARGCNLVEELRDSTAHAEIICIREASNVLRTWRLSETTLYITLEPCPMCAGAILQARIDSVVWGAPNKLLGADGSWIRLFPSGDGGNNGLEQSDKAAAPVHPFHPNIIVRRGVLASECGDAMQQFFKLRRKKEKKPETPTTPPGPQPSSCLPISRHPSKFLSKMHRHI